MKHFINILVILLLFASAAGIASLAYNSPKETNYWGWLFLPLTGMMFAWGYKLKMDYTD